MSGLDHFSIVLLTAMLTSCLEITRVNHDAKNRHQLETGEADHDLSHQRSQTSGPTPIAGEGTRAQDDRVTAKYILL